MRRRGNSLRKPRARSGRPAGRGRKNGIAGAAALLGAAALVVSAVPAQAVAASAAAGPEVVPGKGTSTPSLVDGIRDRTKATGNAADAAREHLADKQSRYHIGNPQRDLAPLGTQSSGATETVRLQQKHHGIDVLGGQYVVRMEKKDGKRLVTGTSGRYFTRLTADTKAAVTQDVAVERAVAAVRAQLGGRTLDKSDIAQPGRQGLTRSAESFSGTARGLVVLPKGDGVLTQHVTVRGTHPATGEPVLREVYIDAKAGYPVLQYSGIKTFGVDKNKTAAPAKGGIKADAPAPTPGSGVKYDGTTVDLNLTKDPGRNEYLMRDTVRMSSTSHNVLATWDARGKDVGEVSGRWPDGIKEFGSATPAFGPDATEAGAVDAHWAAGKVYDYYKNVHGRDSLDGRGMTVNSLVGVTEFGSAYVNAFWDGTKMVYGGGNDEYKTLSADLDVVGHEMTHGVVEHTANLVYAGQSGALNEALADYFGQSISVDAAGVSMDDPDSGLLGGHLCRSKSPRECAFRDLNDGATTSKNFLGVGFATDNGGVHLNSTIFSGSLWDIRKDLGGKVADRIVYKALSEYMTPLDGYTEGRNAVIAAAKDLGLSSDDVNTVTRSFNAHGIVPNWELALGVDTDVLLGKVNTAGSSVGAGGGWWTASQSDDSGTEAYSVWAGRADGKGAPKLISPNDGRYHVNPVTDGKTVVWLAYGPKSVDILARPLAGGPIRTLRSGKVALSGVQVDGDVVVFEAPSRLGTRHVGYLRLRDTDPVWVEDRADEQSATALPSIGNGRIAYAKLYAENGTSKFGTEVLDLKTGKKTLTQQLGTPEGIGQTGINGKNVFWLADESKSTGQMGVRRAEFDGTGTLDLGKGKTAAAGLFPYDLTVSQDAVTVTSQAPGLSAGNQSTAKLWQFSVDGRTLGRVSCNRGEQLSAAAAGGRQVVWLDGTTGFTDLVTRTRPAGTCG
ncbi:M4 family metallopeptidase [Streptoverticillium reticulum]|uniref:M4 family metallopeptidase n=1 Tax=Streptoverticillium reticulum TaxID=1433415 RepID=UPI0039BEE82D